MGGLRGIACAVRNAITTLMSFCVAAPRNAGVGQAGKDICEFMQVMTVTMTAVMIPPR